MRATTLALVLADCGMPAQPDVQTEHPRAPKVSMRVMPVPATWISQYDMTGVWSCHVFLDGASTEAAHADVKLQ
jgi:hypothetical protein